MAAHSNNEYLELSVPSITQASPETIQRHADTRPPPPRAPALLRACMQLAQGTARRARPSRTALREPSEREITFARGTGRRMSSGDCSAEAVGHKGLHAAHQHNRQRRGSPSHDPSSTKRARASSDGPDELPAACLHRASRRLRGGSRSAAFIERIAVLATRRPSRLVDGMP